MNLWEDGYLTEPMFKKDPIAPTCSHEWLDYTGLNETFKFCKRCDEKRK